MVEWRFTRNRFNFGNNTDNFNRDFPYNRKFDRFKFKLGKQSIKFYRNEFGNINSVVTGSFSYNGNEFGNLFGVV